MSISSRVPLWGVFLLLIVPLGLGALACGRSAAPAPTQTAAPAPTDTAPPPATATPTQTPLPTDTPEPTRTSTPTRTATPNRTATAAVKATQRIEDGIAVMKADLEKIELEAGPGHVGWIQDENVYLDLTGYDEMVYNPIAENMKANDFILKTDISWSSSGGLVSCGLMFRSESNFEEGAQYYFEMTRLSGLPAWVIGYIRYHRIERDISGVRTSSAIDQGQGATNQLILVVEDGKFTLYINGIRLGSFYDHSEQRKDGYFAFIAYQESGETTCQFDNTWVWLLDEQEE